MVQEYAPQLSEVFRESIDSNRESVDIVNINIEDIILLFGLLPIAFAIVDRLISYRTSIFLSVCSGLNQFFLGGVNIVVLNYVLISGNAHAALCTFGWHFFCAEAILSFNYTNGWSSPLMLAHRRLAHGILQLCCIILVLSGTIVTLIDSGISITTHGMTGFLAFIMTLVNALLGPSALLPVQMLKVIHTFIAIPTFIMSAICLCTSFLLTSFQDYSGEEFSYFMIFCVVMYTLFTICIAIDNVRFRIEYFL